MCVLVYQKHAPANQRKWKSPWHRGSQPETRPVNLRVGQSTWEWWQKSKPKCKNATFAITFKCKCARFCKFQTPPPSHHHPINLRLGQSTWDWGPVNLRLATFVCCLNVGHLDQSTWDWASQPETGGQSTWDWLFLCAFRMWARQTVKSQSGKRPLS